MGCTVYLLILFVGFNLKFFKLKEKNERQSKLFIIRSQKSSVRMNCLLFVLIKYSCLIFWTVQGHTTDIYLSTQVWIRWNRVEIENKILYLGKYIGPWITNCCCVSPSCCLRCAIFWNDEHAHFEQIPFWFSAIDINIDN